jgi:hypothetical protein
MGWLMQKLVTLVALMAGLMAFPIQPRAAAPVVWVTSDKLRYHYGEQIVVTISNDLPVPIYGQTGQTYCSVVSVQRKVDDQWNMEGRCAAAGPPGFIAIEAGRQMAVEIFPRFPSDRALDPGQYRIVFSFFVGSTAGPRQAVQSEEFVIATD